MKGNDVVGPKGSLGDTGVHGVKGEDGFSGDKGLKVRVQLYLTNCITSVSHECCFSWIECLSRINHFHFMSCRERHPTV